MATITNWSAIFPNAKQSEAKPLIDGEAYFDAVLDAINTATSYGHFIYTTGWGLDLSLEIGKGANRQTLASHLVSAAKRGAKVKILYWDNPTKLQTHSKINIFSLPHYNISTFRDRATYAIPQTANQLSKVVSYLESILKAVTPSTRFLAPRPTLSQSILYSKLTSGDPSVEDLISWAKANQYSICAHHEKNVIVNGSKGLIAFCGGIDFNKNRLPPEKIYFPPGNKYTHSYHDVACLLEGQAAYDVYSKFVKRWNNHPEASMIKLEKSPAIPKPSGVQKSGIPLNHVVGTYNSPDGTEKERRLSHAYFKVIKNAKQYVYIEDQYLVNLDIAAELNKKIREKDFLLVMMVVQDSDETEDILIPNKKRKEFIDTIKHGATKSEQEKVLYTVIDKQKQGKFHTGLHSKVLVADDEIAIIGSANVNQRSFTLDSETSVVLIDESFVKMLRIALWEDTFLPEKVSLIRKDKRFIDWKFYPTVLRNPNSYKQISDASFLKEYTTPNLEDLDKKVIKSINDLNSAVKWFVKGQYDVKEITKLIYALEPKVTPRTSSELFDNPEKYIPELIDKIIWDNIIDPKI